MPFIALGTNAEFNTNITTSATPNTEQVDAYVSVPVAYLAQTLSVLVGGRAAGLTVISGIGFRIKRATGAAASGGNIVSVGDGKADVGAQTLRGSINIAFRAPTAITAGVTPEYVGGFSCGATGPGGWICPNAQSLLRGSSDQGLARSVDLYSTSGTASLPYESTIAIQGLIP